MTFVGFKRLFGIVVPFRTFQSGEDMVFYMLLKPYVLVSPLAMHITMA